jgi:hypothetical protein
MYQFSRVAALVAGELLASPQLGHHHLDFIIAELDQFRGGWAHASPRRRFVACLHSWYTKISLGVLS